MNGTHDNFAFTQVASNDPTANLPDGTYTDEHGAPLRDIDRFCAWCQEIVTVRILEKTDQLAEPGDPADPTEQGQTWYARWVNELRENYYACSVAGQQIQDAEARYADAGAWPEWRAAVAVRSLSSAFGVQRSSIRAGGDARRRRAVSHARLHRDPVSSSLICARKLRPLKHHLFIVATGSRHRRRSCVA